MYVFNAPEVCKATEHTCTEFICLYRGTKGPGCCQQRRAVRRAVMAVPMELKNVISKVYCRLVN